jgi:hypothetical protein
METCARVAEVRYEAAACNRDHKIYITIVVHLSSRNPAGYDRTFRIEKLSL